MRALARARLGAMMAAGLSGDMWERVCALSSSEYGAEFVKLLLGSTSTEFFSLLLAPQQAAPRLTYKSVARAAIAEHQQHYLRSPQANLAAPVIGGKRIPVTTSKAALAQPMTGKAFRWVYDHVAPTAGTKHGDALHRLHLLVCDSNGTRNDAAMQWLVDIVADYVVAIAEADPAIGPKRRNALEKVARGAAQAASGTMVLITTGDQPTIVYH